MAHRVELQQDCIGLQFKKIAFYNYRKGGILLLLLLFATMLTGPRIITGVVTLQVVYFKHAEEKDMYSVVQ